MRDTFLKSFLLGSDLKKSLDLTCSADARSNHRFEQRHTVSARSVPIVQDSLARQVTAASQLDVNQRVIVFIEDEFMSWEILILPTNVNTGLPISTVRYSQIRLTFQSNRRSKNRMNPSEDTQDPQVGD